MNTFKLNNSAKQSRFELIPKKYGYDVMKQSIIKEQKTLIYEIPLNLSPFEQHYWLEQIDSQHHFVNLNLNKRSEFYKDVS